MTLPDFPSPWWDVAKYDLQPTRDWKHMLVCKQCGSAIPVQADYVAIHDKHHDALLEVFTTLRKIGEMLEWSTAPEQLDRAVTDPPYPTHAQESRNSWRDIVANQTRFR
jgi:hypothetical protein